MVKCWYKERQYLIAIKKVLQYLPCQGIPPRGNDDGNNSLPQLLLLLVKDHPDIAEKSFSKVYGEKRHTHYHFQRELPFISA